MKICADSATEKADKLFLKFGTRDAYKLANDLGIAVSEQPFVKQKGVYKVIDKHRFIFIKEDLDPITKSIVLLHEIGHDQLHRREAIRIGGFHEFNIFDMRGIRMEYEANIFAANISLPDDEVLELVYRGYDVAQVASTLNSDINLVALKIADLKTKGHNFKEQNVNAKFLA